MLCPTCQKHVHIEIKRHDHFCIRTDDVGGEEELTYIYGDYCPSCSTLIVARSVAGPNPHKGHPDESDWDTPQFQEVIYPKSRITRKWPPSVPHEYRADYDEAVLVLDLSPKSSAALSRRILQRVLREQFNIQKRDLNEEIRTFVDTIHPPTHLAEQLDAIRVIGNFGAHPLKNTSTGEVTEVEPGEAEWLIETLDSLFDFSFVQPAKFAARKAAINAKLRAAGKPELP